MPRMSWVPDVNFLLAASRSDHLQHAPAAMRLDAALSASMDGEGIDAHDLSDALIAGCVITSGARLVTFERGFTRFLLKRQLRTLGPGHNP